MEERNNNNVVTAVIITVLVMIVLGLVGFIVYDKVINKTNEPNTGENNKVDNNGDNQEIGVIEITESLEQQLRKLIPSVKTCNDKYLDKQYNGSIFTSSDLKDVTYFEECQGILDVETLSYKNESTKDEVYLYDYVLIYSQQKAEEGKGNYGTRYDNMDIQMNEIELVGENEMKIAEKSFKEYGQVYKYTFKLVDGNYEYVSTEAVR